MNKYILLLIVILIVFLILCRCWFYRRNENNKYYLYPIDTSSNKLIYQNEIYNILKKKSNISNNPKDPRKHIVVLSNETNYPLYGNPSNIGNLCNFNLNITDFIKKLPYYDIYTKYYIFYHTPPVDNQNIINIGYCKKYNDTNNIIIPPPAITKFKFNNNNSERRKYLLTIKANWSEGHNIDRRKIILNKFKQYDNKKNIQIVDKKYKNPSYSDLMENSVFGIVVQGDLPWSYRLTEVINSGTIPIIIKPEIYNILPYDNKIDYSKCSIILDINEIDDFMKYKLNTYSSKQLNNMINHLKYINNTYFINRESQLNHIL